jgi:ribonuclease D
LLQISLPASDHIVDPLADLDLAPLRSALERSGNCLARRRLRSANAAARLNFVARRILDTLIAARLLGIREFSLAALVKRLFWSRAPERFTESNWAQRPLPARMAEYAINDARYLLPLAEELEAELIRNCPYRLVASIVPARNRAAAVQRVRDEDELWRVRGSGSLRGRQRLSCARFGNGARKKRRRQIDRLFIFCKITNYWTQQWLSPPETCLITGIFPRVAVRHFARQDKA